MERFEHIERLSRLVFESMNLRDFTGLDPHLDEDVCLDFPGAKLAEGKRKVQLFMKVLLRGYPELTFTIMDVLVTADKTCVVWENKGRDTEDKPYSNRGMTLIQFREERIIFISDYFKDTSFIKN